jgi:hypothetical protein
MNEFKVGQIIKYNGMLFQINQLHTQDNYHQEGRTTWLYITGYEYEKEFITCRIKSNNSDISIPTKQEIAYFRKSKHDVLLLELNEIKSLLQQILNK